LQHKKTDPVAVCGALRPYGTSIFTEMTALSNKMGAVNLSQGFPDFDGPESVRRHAAEAVLAGPNQYTPSTGVPELRIAIAGTMRRFYNLTVDADTEITVTAGATEALASAFLGTIEPGDEVVLIAPAYDLYAPIISRSGGVPVYVSLERPGFGLPREALAKAFGPRTRAIVINNPQNPCGKVFSREELEFIGTLCEKHGAFAIGDEVYEHLTYDGRKHTTLLQIPSLRERAIVISSTAKTFSMTGWKVGWAIACPSLSYAVRMSHQYITFCTPGAFQRAMALAIGMEDSYYDGLLADYVKRRSKLCDALSGIGLDVISPEGTYYASITLKGLDFEDDYSFCRHITEKAGVAAIPSSFFWPDRGGGRDLVRFCFCKKDETLDEAIRRLKKWRGR
jgi:N-succinyldiaminopimelate aminotransferase